MNPKLWRDDSPLMEFHYEKGGSAPMPPPPDPMAEARAQMQIDASRADREERAARQRALDEEKKAHKQRDAFEANVGAARNRALNYGSSKVAQLGIPDNYGLLSAYQSELEQALGGIPDLASTVDLNPSGVWDRAYNNVRGQQRSRLNRSLDSFAGSGFENNYFADTADDDILASILNSQTEDATGDIDRARARGQLNDNAFSYATKALGQQKSAANAKLQDLGLGVLNNYRSSLNTKAKNIRDRVQNWDFGDSLDLDAERLGLDTAASGFRNRMEGDLRNTIGDTLLYNIDLLLGKAANKGGTANTGIQGTPNPLAAAFTEEDPNRNRVLQNTGVF